ncbi:FAD-dependent oxidoreductase, partial [Halorubrum sp. AD140]|uniref:NAD(P)/FAD-dependent oxidoreductase n=1 Tax=Halorubrum sp. AD140 TaxID=3050073 RepID=UPI002ACC46DA
MEEANFLTKFADTVYVAHRREEFRAEDVWIERTMEKIEDGEIELLLNTELTEIHGTPEDGVDHVTLVEHPDGHPTEKLADPATADEVREYDFDVGAVFFAIGHTPNTDFLEGTGIETDDEGYLITEGGRGGGQTRTGVAGLFGAGDVVDFHYQQAATASGMGVEAALDADDYLTERERAGELYESEVDAAAADD